MHFPKSANSGRTIYWGHTRTLWVYMPVSDHFRKCSITHRKPSDSYLHHPQLSGQEISIINMIPRDRCYNSNGVRDCGHAKLCGFLHRISSISCSYSSKTICSMCILIDTPLTRMRWAAPASWRRKWGPNLSKEYLEETKSVSPS